MEKIGQPIKEKKVFHPFFRKIVVGKIPLQLGFFTHRIGKKTRA